MKRSEINVIMREADAFIRSFGFKLPPFAYWSEADFRRHADDAKAIFDQKLGWDITDYGQGDFAKTGVFLFTLRNGLYAEKIMISRVNQICPMHRHHVKAEDIINRGGGTLAVELFMSDAQGGMDHEGRGYRGNRWAGAADGGRKPAQAFAGGKRDASSRCLACLLGRGPGCAGGRGFHRQ